MAQVSARLLPYAELAPKKLGWSAGSLLDRLPLLTAAREAVHALRISHSVESPMSHKAASSKIRELLRRYDCLVPYHEVRTRFLGNIASPGFTVSPMRIVEDLWGGDLPVFASMDDANELIGELVNGLWNALTRHQKRTAPFRLVRVQGEPSPEALSRLALVRRQEIDGFVGGLFHGADDIDLPRKASDALDRLAEARAMFAAVEDLIARGIDPKEAADVATTWKHLAEMQKIVEREMHTVVVECARAAAGHGDGRRASDAALVLARRWVRTAMRTTPGRDLLPVTWLHRAIEPTDGEATARVALCALRTLAGRERGSVCGHMRRCNHSRNMSIGPYATTTRRNLPSSASSC